jgi:sulfopyruvate decarboxylase subunit alpha
MVAAIRRQGITWLILVPASGLDHVYRDFEEQARCIFVTREEEGVAMAAGLVAGGARAVVLMQQSGVGNCLNAVISLADAYDVRFPILVACRPDDDENPVQRTSARRTRKILTELAAEWLDWQTPDAAGSFDRACDAGCRWIVFPA